MKRSLKKLIGYTMGAIDGEIGKVKEFYFDDETWTIRYLIVETGSLFFDRTVLISPEALLPVDWEKRIFPVNLTIDQIEKSPNIDTEKPVSRLHEMQLYQHYPWKNYWGGNFHGSDLPISTYQVLMKDDEKIHHNQTDENVHLRSSAKVMDYGIKTDNGKIGDVEDFLIDDKTWKIDFIVADTGSWFAWKKVLLTPKLVKEINWNNSSLIINATGDKVKNSPAYYSDVEVTQDDVETLNDYYMNSVL
jgi:uncharacterized protein YrrD